MSKESCEEAYAEGLEDGKNTNLVDGVAQSVGKMFNTTEEQDSYDAGYTDGVNSQ